ncbi:MAG: hypothetical protein ACHRHE_04110 [Tepidisphaerales bacterium]
MQHCLGRKACLLVLTFCTVAAAYGATALGAEAAAAQARVGNVLFTMPEGWQRKDQDDGSVLLTPLATPPGQWYQIRLLPPDVRKGTLHEQFLSELASFRQAYKGVEAGQIIEQRHTNGYDIALSVMSMENKDKAGEFLYCMLSMSAAGDRVHRILLTTNNSTLFNQNRKVSDGLLNSVRYASLVVLAKGRPPLTQATVDEVADFVEWLMEVPLTDGQRQAVQQHLIDSWNKNDKEEMDGTAEVLKVRTQLSAMTKAQRELARQAVQPELIKNWRQDRHAIARTMLGIYDAAHQPIAAGEPPLTRQSADATIELLYFMASQVAGGEEVQPTAGVKDEWARNLAAGYAAMNADAKKEIGQMPMAWAAVRYAWPEMPAQERAKLKESWGQSPQIKELSASLVRIRAEAAASKTERLADAMRKMQDHQDNMRTLMNISNMQHQTNMAIIHNMNSGWHYEYRYR